MQKASAYKALRFSQFSMVSIPKMKAPLHGVFRFFTHSENPHFSEYLAMLKCGLGQAFDLMREIELFLRQLRINKYGSDQEKKHDHNIIRA